MSSVVISGDTSGAITLQAPAVSGNTTLNLPASSGTLLTTASTSGANGSAISTGIVAEAYGGTGTSTGYYGFKNKLINGNFDIWQRAISSTSSLTYGSADRFYQIISGTVTIAQETSIVPAGSRYALKWTTGANSSFGQIRQPIEAANVIPLRGKTVTASALVRSSAGFSGNLTFECRYSNSSDAMASLTTNVSIPILTGQITSSGYTKITGTFTVPSDAVGLYIAVVPTQVQNTGIIAYISQFQLEEGSTATSFDNRPYNTELQLCQRYFEKTYDTDIVVGTTATYTGTWCSVVLNAGDFYDFGRERFKVTKRTIPTITAYNPQTGAAGTGRMQGTLDRTLTPTDIGQNGFRWFGSSMSANNYVQVHWTASSEL